MINVTIGEEGLKKSWQGDFPKTAKCECGGEARHAFTAFEEPGKEPKKGELPEALVCQIHPNDPKGEGYWLHDCCAVAIYLCKKCLKPVAMYNQG